MQKLKQIFWHPFFGEKKIWHNLFELTIFAKGVYGVFDIIIGSLFVFLSTSTIQSLMVFCARGPARDFFMYYAGQFSTGSRSFLAVYFLSYGVANLFLMVCLLWGKLWSYPAAITFFGGFIVYLCYRFYLYGSGLLLFFIAFDLFFVVLVFLEYRRVKNAREAKNAH